MLEIRPYQEDDEAAVVQLWRVVFPDDPPWNEPILVIRRKLKLQIRDGNEAAVHFYASLGFGVEDRVSMSQLLEAAPDA